MDFGASTTLRFLPRSNQVIAGVRPPFWIHKRVLRLDFANPTDLQKRVSISIPCLSMYDPKVKTKDDPILVHAQQLYEAADAAQKKGHDERSKQLRETANRHWVKAKGEALAQGFVIRPGVLEQNIPENPVRLFDLKTQIMNTIHSALDEEHPDEMLAGSPDHGMDGTNFIIKKTRSGEWPSYKESCFAKKSTTLTDEHLAALRQYGLFDLTSYLPDRPTADEYVVLSEIVAQSVAGNRVWNPDWEQHLINVKPYKDGVTAREEADEGTGETVAGVAAVIDAMNKTGRKSDVTKTQAETAPQAEAAENNAAAARAEMDKARAALARVRARAEANKASPQGETVASLQAAA
jgi:hypothetical protein